MDCTLNFLTKLLWNYVAKLDRRKKAKSDFCHILILKKLLAAHNFNFYLIAFLLFIKIQTKS
ncbi:hypothetical protein BOW57_15085 [Flavobacterium sp. YO64]|nr:hypothetical protein BOW57_15085 [Flavobacterium sp. YO64]